MKPMWLMAVVSVALISAVEVVALETGAGVVRGAQSLNLRSGAGTDYAPIGRLGTGDRVEIKSINGSWATVRTASGRTGYIRVEYLANQAPPKGRDANAPKSIEPVAPQEQAPIDAPTAATAPPPTALLEEVNTLRAHNSKLESELAGIRAQLAAASPQAKANGGELDGLRADVGRVLALAEEINKRVALEKRESGPSEPGERPVIDPNVWLLAGACVVFGALVGGGYGRFQDRSRRSRIRL